MRDARYDTVQGIILTAAVLWIDLRMIEDFHLTPRPLWLYVGLFLVVTSALLAYFESRRRKAKAELEQLVAIQRQLGTD
jgi:hypothetical protein